MFMSFIKLQIQKKKKKHKKGGVEKSPSNFNKRL